MPTEMAIWRMSSAGPTRLTPSQLSLEERLEDMLVDDPLMTGTDLLVIGRQVRTDFGGFIDVLALDSDGRIHVLELKRDRTPRDVVAQTLDYGSWVRGLSLDDLEQIFSDRVGGDSELDASFADRFDTPLPDVVNLEQQLTIVASELDDASDRIVEYLAENYGVPINAVFFRYFEDDGREYLARTWLLDPADVEAQTAKKSRTKRRPWNGRDFYVILGNTDGSTPRWDLARRYGLISAGAGSWYTKPLRNLVPSARVFAYVGGAGYVGVGRITGTTMPMSEAKVDVDGVPTPVIDLPNLDAQMRERAVDDDPELTEMVVAVEWLETRPVEEAVKEAGLFASQVTVCKLRDDHTIETLEAAFNVVDD